MLNYLNYSLSKELQFLSIDLSHNSKLWIRNFFLLYFLKSKANLLNKINKHFSQKDLY